MSDDTKKKNLNYKDAVLTLCDYVGHEDSAGGNILRLFRCPNHDIDKCTIQDGIVRQVIGGGWTSSFHHLRRCLGGVDCLREKYLEAKKKHLELGIVVEEPTVPSRKRGGKPIKEKKEEKRNILQKRTFDNFKLTENELKDARSSLEHVLMVGAKNEHDKKRRKSFEVEHQVLLEMEHDLPLNIPLANPLGPQEHPDNNVFAEDMRIYGEVVKKRGYSDTDRAASAWPAIPSGVGPNANNNYYLDNKLWNIEHGDTINPLAFSKARLSDTLPTEKDRDFIDGENLLIDTTDVGLTDNQVPRALLLRCWERAVHAASCTMHAPKIGNTEIANKDLTTENDWRKQAKSSLATLSSQRLPTKTCSRYTAEQQETAQSSKATKAKMTYLGFTNTHCDDNVCPRCSATFDNHLQLQKHFYGGDNVRGCCWGLINEKQLSLIDNVLQRHIITQAELIVSSIVSEAKERVHQCKEDGKSKELLRLFNWHDILKFMESDLQSSKCVPTDADPIEGNHPIIECLETKEGESPMVFNPGILEAVRRRLIDRYADVAP